jgi:L-ribulose-5-phosphate 3-epimerase
MRAYQLGLYEKSMPGGLTIPDKLREAGVAGFDYLELSIDETDAKLARLDWTRGEIESLNAAQEEIGVPIKSICLSAHRRYPLGHPDSDVRRRSLAIMEGALRLSARLGVRIIQLAGYDVYYEPSTAETAENFAAGLRASAEMAAREGVILGFETMETEFMNTVGKAMKWVRLVDSPYLQIYPDLGNLTNAAIATGTDVLEDLRAGKGHLAALHLKETRPGVFRDLRFGEGHVRFPEAATAAMDMGVRLFVGEFWHLGEEDWRRTLTGSASFLRNALDNA